MYSGNLKPFFRRHRFITWLCALFFIIISPVYLPIRTAWELREDIVAMYKDVFNLLIFNYD
jgi:hypothetical protein